MQDQNLVGHLSATEMLGLSPSSQFQLAAFRVAYSPRMWANAAQQGLKWPGTFFVGGKVVKGAFDAMGEGFGPGKVKNVMGGIGTFFGGATGGTISGFKVAHYDIFNKSFSSGQMFTKSGFQKLRFGYGRANVIAGKEFTSSIGHMWRSGTRIHPSMVSHYEAMGGLTGTNKYYTYHLAEGGKQVGMGSIKEAYRQGFKSNLAKFLGTRAMAAVSTALTAKLIFDVTSAIGYGAVAGVNAIAARISSNNLLDFGSGSADFAQSSGAYTERQRAVRSIQSSNLNGRRFLGNEAAMVHV